jgi:hypothetical protein
MKGDPIKVGNCLVDVDRRRPGLIQHEGIMEEHSAYPENRSVSTDCIRTFW